MLFKRTTSYVLRNRNKRAHLNGRNVSTSHPDKGLQCLATAPKPEIRDMDAGQVKFASLKSDQVAARLERLELWHSLDTIKRLGHRAARLDPLELTKPSPLRELAWSHALIERLAHDQSLVPTLGLLDTRQSVMPVRDLANRVHSIYTDADCGLEFEHVSSRDQVDWLTSQWEQLNESFTLSPSDELNLAKLLLECEAFDLFMAAKVPTIKRYGCEGAEGMLVVFDEILRLCQLGATQSQQSEIEHVIIGMPHRGRLNLLACLLDFDPKAIFHKARGRLELDSVSAWMASGDVLSHLSTNVRYVYGQGRLHGAASALKSGDSAEPSGRPLNVSLLPNPSHLELVAPVVAGVARGRAHNLLHGYSSSPKFIARPEDDTASSSGQVDMNGGQYAHHFASILPIQVHGDASLAGQGVIAETLQMAKLKHFDVGGSLHVVVNNQIGYTTDQSSGRSTRHCTDVFKMIEAPVIHVNGENVSALIKATRLALNYRRKFNKDIAINMICYRKRGHNEMDEPLFTQPEMYAAIGKRKSLPQTYADSIGLDEARRKSLTGEFRAKLQQALNGVDSFRPDNDNYRNFSLASEAHRAHLFSWPTGYDLGALRRIGLDSVCVPKEFRLHETLKRALVGERRARFNYDEKLDGEEAVNCDDSSEDRRHFGACPVDWACAEMLAFGSLLRDNQTVRLAGQDVARGTFSSRHAILLDQASGVPYAPLNRMGKHANLARLEVANTILSEEASMAFEFGYSIETCSLTLWEAQFGDFYNTAQSVVDTLVSSSESKWLRQSALVLLLPHGLDGAGPEHSSGRLERFLQLSSSSTSQVDTEAATNWSVCYPTLPAQYFHLLRRQVVRPFRKPLVVMAPKSIFRHRKCQSDLADFGPSTSFQAVLDDPVASQADAKQVDTLVLCSGKLFFALDELRNKLDMKNVALVRLEELCPFPAKQLADVLAKYERVSDPIRFVWLLEEHRNQGAFEFVRSRMSNMLNVSPRYLGRHESELPAAGSTVLHAAELDRIYAQFEALKN